MELEQYLGLFIEESKENLQKLNEELLKLETDPANLDVLNDMFRVAHTLKGMAKTMGFNDIGDLTHNMENLLDPLRNGTIKADDAVVDTLFKCLDGLEGLVQKVIEGSYEDNKNSLAKELTIKLQELLGKKAEIEENETEQQVVEFDEYEKNLINAAREQGFIAREITVLVEDDCMLPAARAFMVHKAVEPLGEVIKTHPSVEDLENGDFKQSFKLFILTQSSDNEINQAINSVSEIKEVKINNIDFNQSQKSVQSTISENNSEQKAESQASTKVIPQTIRVNADRMNQLMDLVGELVITRTRITLISSLLKDDDLKSAVESMEHITSDVQEVVMKLRMVTIEQVFNRFPRLVRDVSKELKKDVNLRLIGKDTEIDRIVIDEIGDPLVHLIRNSLDHGLETPEERISAGKPAKGTLELLAFNEGDNILIRVSDDGRGVDPKKIKDTAIKKGIVKTEEIKNISDKDALDLLFLPGFSTAKETTDISGRGVGMDVVKSKVAALGGNVSIDSRIGVGTIVTISLPSSMAIVQSLLIKVGDEIYAAPLNYISEIIEVLPNQIKRVQNKEVIVLRGKTLPLIRMHRLLEVPNYEEDINKPSTVVILKCQDKHIGIIVSELIGQQEIVVKPMNKNLCANDLFSGATTLGDGKVALILSISTLLRTSDTENK